MAEEFDFDGHGIDLENDYPEITAAIGEDQLAIVAQKVADGALTPTEGRNQFAEARYAKLGDAIEDLFITVNETVQLDEFDETEFVVASDFVEESEDNPEYVFAEEDLKDYPEVRNRAVRQSRWALGDHTMPEDVDRPDVPDVPESVFDQAIEMFKGSQIGEVLGFAKEQAEQAEVSGYECEECGLVHNHSDTKHDIRSFFNVREDFVARMEFNPFCHCGVNELARLMNHFEDIQYPVFTDQDTMTISELARRKEKIRSGADSAPVPDEVTNRLDEMFSDR